MKKETVLLFLLLFPFLLIAFFNHPSLDDYWNANTIMANGRLYAVGYSFHHFSGRYFSSFLMCLLNTLPQGKIWIFKIFPLIISTGLVSACYNLLRKVPIQENRQEALTFAFLLLLLHILNMRVLYEGLYWMSATVTYQVGIILYLYLLVALFSYADRKSLPKLIGLVILTACMTGTSESAEPLFLATVLFLYFKFEKEKKTQAQRALICCFIVNLICIFFLLSSEGLRSRVDSDLAKAHPLFQHALLRSFESTVYYFAIWCFNPFNIFSALILLPYLKDSFLTPEYKQNGRKNLKMAIIISVAAVLTSVAVYLPSFYLESDRPMPRITTIVYLIFWIAFLKMLALTVFRVNKLVEWIRLRLTKTLLWTALLLSAIASKNFLKVSSDLFSGTAFRFNQEQNQRYRDLRNCPYDTCFIAPLKNWPPSIEQGAREQDVPDFLRYWDIYFNKKKILVIKKAS